MSMHEGDGLIESVLQAANGKIIGRIRFQKICYLLQQLGLGANLRFSYHHYGPYSEELSVAIDRARVLDKTIKEDKVQSSDGGFYSVYSYSGTKMRTGSVGGLPLNRARELIAMMKAETSTVIELAATIHWLRKKEKVSDWRRELKIRKGAKADDALIKKAESVLQKLNLWA
jgi:uncharacterized protein